MCTIQQHPGKFESESCITIVAHDVVMNGLADDCETHNTDESDNCRTMAPDAIPYTTNHREDIPLSICDECVKDLQTAHQDNQLIHQWEDDNGFEYSSIESV